MKSRYPVKAAVLVLAVFGCGSALAADDYSNGVRAGLPAYDMTWHNFSELPVDKALREKENARRKAAMAPASVAESADSSQPKRKKRPRTPR
jgi:hypothetical protein